MKVFECAGNAKQRKNPYGPRTTPKKKPVNNPKVGYGGFKKPTRSKKKKKA